MSAKKRMSVKDIKKELSEKEFAETRGRIERATEILGDVKKLLSSALFLQNGKLSTGNI